jgi:hypothetical protein
MFQVRGSFFEISIHAPVRSAGTMQRTDSVLPVSSVAATSICVVPVQNGTGQPVANYSAPTHDETGLAQDFDVASVGSATSGLSTGTLQVRSKARSEFS